ncbi:unnamed protein product, partial [Ectocarpus fasciculatus]
PVEVVGGPADAGARAAVDAAVPAGVVAVSASSGDVAEGGELLPFECTLLHLQRSSHGLVCSGFTKKPPVPDRTAVFLGVVADLPSSGDVLQAGVPFHFPATLLLPCPGRGVDCLSTPETPCHFFVLMPSEDVVAVARSGDRREAGLSPPPSASMALTAAS